MREPFRLVAIADSAFRAEGPDCQALRGAVIALVSTADATCPVGGKAHFLELLCRKQTRVNRGTSGAELNNCVEAAEFGMLLQGCLHEVFTGVLMAMNLAKMLDNVQLSPPLHLVIDAHTVVTAVSAETVTTPNERQQLYPLQSLREHLDASRTAKIHRIDTRDMLADALTKGSISRPATLEALAKCEWRLIHREQLHSWPTSTTHVAGTACRRLA